MRAYITTYRKKHINVNNLDANEICYEDIAHSLSLICRANGHYPRFYSVAQHSLDCLKEAKSRHLSKRLQFAALLHDSAQAYLGDVVSPVKQCFVDFNDYEKKVLDVIYEKYLSEPLSPHELDIVEDIDYTLFCHEFYAIMGEEPAEDMPKIYSSPDFKTKPAIEMEEEYKRCFRKYLPKK